MSYFDLLLLSQEISQDSQEYLPRGQKILQKVDIKVARTNFNDKLIVKNNVNNSDKGVKKVLHALDNDVNLKAVLWIHFILRGIQIRILESTFWKSGSRSGS